MVEYIQSKLPAVCSIEKDFGLSKAEVLGMGAQGQVFKVYESHDKEKKLPFAVKVINKNCLDFDTEDKIYNEPNALLQLSHPNIVKYHSTYEDTSKIYFVMEFCPSELFDTKNFLTYHEDDASEIIE